MKTTDDHGQGEDPATRAIADRARMSYDETAEMLAGFRSALRRAEADEADGDGR